MFRVAGKAIAIVALLSGCTSAAAVASLVGDEELLSPTTTVKALPSNAKQSTSAVIQPLSQQLVERGAPKWLKDKMHTADCVAAHFFHDRSAADKCDAEDTEQVVQLLQLLVDTGAMPLDIMCYSYAHGVPVQLAPDITKGRGVPDPAVVTQVANGDYSHIVDGNTDGNNE